MEVRLQPEKEAQLAQIAEQRGLKPADLAQQVLSRYLEDDTCFIEAVNSAWQPQSAGNSWSTTKWAPS